MIMDHQFNAPFGGDCRIPCTIVDKLCWFFYKNNYKNNNNTNPKSCSQRQEWWPQKHNKNSLDLTQDGKEETEISVYAEVDTETNDF